MVLIVVTIYQPNVEYLRELLASIKSQTYQAFTCLLCVDGLPIDVGSIYDDTVGDARFRIVSDGNHRGQFKLIEHVLANHLGAHDLVVIADQDDVWCASHLEDQVAHMVRGPYSMVTNNARILVSTTGNHHKIHKRMLFPALGITENSPEFVLMTNFATGAGSIYRAEILKKSLPFPEEHPSLVHDHWLLLVSLSVAPCFINENATWFYRQHENNLIGVMGVLTRAGRASKGALKLFNIFVNRWICRRDPKIELATRLALHISATYSHPLFLQLFKYRLSRGSSFMWLFRPGSLKTSRLETVRMFLWRKQLVTSLNDSIV